MTVVFLTSSLVAYSSDAFDVILQTNVCTNTIARVRK